MTVVEEEQASVNPLVEGGLEDVDDAHRGSWLSETDELAQECFRCESPFHPVKNRRHHCRRCGDTFCISCSSRYQPLLVSGLETPQRVCDECYDAAGRDNDFKRRHAPVLERGAIMSLKGARLWSGTTTVVLRIDDASLSCLDQASVASAPKLCVPLESISKIVEKGPSLVVTYGAATTAHLEAPAPRPDLAEALRVAASRAAAPSVKDLVAARRDRKRREKRQQAARKMSDDKRASRSADRESMRAKYGLRP